MTLNDFIVFTIYTLLYTVGFGLLSVSMLPLIEICNDNLKWKYIIGFFLLLIVSISLIAISALLTSLNIFFFFLKFAGAGTLIPITGFANSIVSPAIEYKSEGYVMGVGGKMFTVAGPVLVFGISTSIIVGIIASIF